MSSIILFSDVRDPFDITSNRDLISVKSCTGIGRPSIVMRSAPRVVATSKRSLKAITSPVIDDRVTLRGLQDLKLIGIISVESSPRKQMCPSCEDRSALFAKDESENPILFIVSLSSCGTFSYILFCMAYLTALLIRRMSSFFLAA